MNIPFKNKIILLALMVISLAMTNDYLRAKMYLRDFDFLMKKSKVNQVSYYEPQLMKKISEYHEYATLAFKSQRYKTTIGYTIAGRELVQKALALTARKAQKKINTIITNSYGTVKVKIAYTNKILSSYKNMKLQKNDEIIVGNNSNATLLFGSFGVVFLGANTRLKIHNITKDERFFKYSVVLELLNGIIRARLNNFNFKVSVFRIISDGSKIRSQSKYFIINRQGRAESIINFNGSLALFNNSPETIWIKAHQAFYLGKITDIDTPPTPIYPQDTELKMRRSMFRWSGDKRINSYRIQISHSIRFNKPVRDKTSSSYRIEIKNLSDGQYFWRIRGEYNAVVYTDWSKIVRFYVKQDTIPPKLDIYTPKDGEVINREYVYVSGRTEPLARIRIDSFKLTADTYGEFAKGLIMKEGLHIVKVKAYDKNDNLTERSVIISVDYTPPPLIINNKVPEYTSGDILKILGTTDDNVHVRVNGKGVPLTNGNFIINYFLKEGGNKITIDAIDKGKNYSTRTFYVIRDSIPPVLRISEPPSNTKNIPVYSGHTITIKGTTESYVRLTINNVKLRINKNPKFIYKYFAANGINIMRATAEDSAANRTDKYITFLVDTSNDKLVKSDTVVIFKKNIFNVNGFTYPNKTVFLNNKPFYADNKGIFKGELRLVGGKTKLKIEIR